MLHLPHYNLAEWCYTYKLDQCYTSRITTARSGATPTNQTSATPPALQQRGVVLHLQTRPVLHLPHYNLAEWCYTDQCYSSRITTSRSGATPTNQSATPPALQQRRVVLHLPSATPPALQPRGVVLHLQTRPVLHLPHYNSAEWCYTYKPDQCYTSRITTLRSGATPTNQTSATPPALPCGTTPTNQTSATPPALQPRVVLHLQTRPVLHLPHYNRVVLHLQTRPVLHLPHYNLAEWCYTYKPDKCITTSQSGATYKPDQCYTSRITLADTQTRPVLHLPHYNLAEWCYTYKPDQCYTSRITTAQSGATPLNQTSATPPALQPRGVVLHLQTRPVLHLPHYNSAEWCYTYKPDQCYTSRITTLRSGATPTNQTSATPPALEPCGMVLHLQTRPVLHLPHYHLAEWCYTYKPDQCYTSRITTSRSGATPTN